MEARPFAAIVSCFLLIGDNVGGFQKVRNELLGLFSAPFALLGAVKQQVENSFRTDVVSSALAENLSLLGT